MDNIKDIVSGVIGKIAEKNPEQENKLESILKNILSAEEGKHTRLVGQKEGVVSICVDSSTWAYQLKLKKRKILDRLKEEITEIRDIRFRIGKIT